MRLRCGLVVLVVALAACGSSAGRTSRDGAPAGCAPRGAQILLSNARAAVFKAGRIVYGCSTGTGKSLRLGSAGFCVNSDRIGPIALSGTIAAFGIQRCGVDTGTAQAVSRRLTDGAVLHTAPATSRVAGAESYQSVGSIVVKTDGAVAWIGQAHSIVAHGPAVLEVHRLDSHGAAELDRGAGIAPGSLRLRGSQLSWLDSRRRRSATLS